jgi:beta-phosphoglucomutase family hydrolase
MPPPSSPRENSVRDPERKPGSPPFAAAIFDLDGVLTQTAAAHAAAWKQTFDEYLGDLARRSGTPHREFAQDADYRAYVDGRPRYQGVEAFLESRGIHLPPGSPEDPPELETVCGLGNRKNQRFNAIVESSGVSVYGSTLVLIQDLLKAGVKVGLATSSRNAALVLARTQTAGLFATVVDGIVSEQRGLQGKPHPDIFVAACANLGVPPARAIVVEDAVAGVRAGAAGGFGLVVGVARENNARELQENGADFVVRDLAEVTVEEISQRVRRKRAA